MNYNETSQWAADLGSGYSSIRPLGEGGMGTLYRAHKDSLDVDVVIKRVKHMWNRQSFSIGRESIRSASMQWKRRSRVS